VPRVIALSSGADARVTGDIGEQAVVCVDGGSGPERDGDWSATLEWLVRRLAPSFPGLAFLEVRYRIDLAVAGGSNEVALLGFSLGGAVAIGIADHAAVTTVLGLAPWIPDRLDVSTLDGKRMAVVHGQLDALVPGIPGVSPRHMLRGLGRIRSRGVDASHTLISGAVHGVAVRGPFGTLLPLPRARRWARLVAEELARFAG
jgi:hypothetical protein